MLAKKYVASFSTARPSGKGGSCCLYSRKPTEVLNEWEFRDHFCLLNSVSIQLVDGNPMSTEKVMHNTIYFTKEQFNAGLRFPLLSLFKEFLHYTQIPPAYIHPNIVRVLIGCSILNILFNLAASLQGQALSWFHRLPPNSVGNFRDLSEAFVGQYLCSARHKQNISTLQNIKMQDNESLREFVKRFGQAVLQVEACSMDVVLQIFKRSICPGTPFFESLAKKPPTTMDDLFRRANKYSMLEDDVRAATQ